MLSFCRSGLLALTRLQDNSVLTEYYGETNAVGIAGVHFRVGFIPRFGCAPVLTMTFNVNKNPEAASGVLRTRKASDLGSLMVWIDDSPLPFPVLVDEEDDNLLVFLNEDLQRRLTAKLRVEVGNLMDVVTRQNERVRFSLLGSRDSISIANQNCRRHDPSIQG